ncbi:MAG: tyrosine--tRNA ligase [Candidatus Moraniibacteriota bacterium]
MKKEELTIFQKRKLIDDVLSRGVGEFFDPNDEFRNKLIAKAKGEYDKPIIVKFGVDPTRPDIHLGHAVCLRKLSQLQILGCKVIFLVGDYTATIGDPTGKSKARPVLSFEEVHRNAETYLQQIGKIVDVGDLSDTERFSWITNSDWLLSVGQIPMPTGTVSATLENGEEKVQFNSGSYPVRAALWSLSRMQKTYLGREEIAVVALNNLLFVLQHITHSRLIERDMFQQRIENNEPLFMHEMLYPVFQGIDSHALARIYGTCDLEIGGTDQTFNMIVGRDVMSVNGQEPQSVLAFKLIEGLDGKEKMSKSLDNYIAITDEPNEMFGKTMSIPDTSIANYFELATDVPMDEIGELKEQLEDKSVNPRDLKVRLAKEIVTLYHGAEAGVAAEQYFIDTFSKGQTPTEMPSVTASEGMAFTELMVLAGVATSKGEARRKIEQGGVSVNDKKIEDFSATVSKDLDGAVVKVGKKDFFRIIL